MPGKSHHQLFIVAAIIGLALNLRPAMASIGPLLDMIERTTGTSHTWSSLLTAVPVFVMGVCALGSNRMITLLGERKGVFMGIALIGLACAARYVLTGGTGLLLTAMVAGMGIALVQTLLPTFIKRRFVADAGRVFALYTTGIMAGAAIAAASAAGLASSLGHWSLALAIWAVPALLMLPCWSWATRVPAAVLSAAPVRSVAPAERAFWRNGRAWALLLFFGIGTGAYTLVLAWLPPFYTSLGWPASSAGLLLGGLTLVEVLAGLAVSCWIGRFPDRRKPLLMVLIALLSGLMCLLLAPLDLALLACILLGAGIGALFPLSLIVALDHLEEPAQAGMLLAFVQGGGYIIASFMPLIAGLLRDQFSSLDHAWQVMMVGVLLLMGLCLRFSPESYRRINC